jgi:hypothetical protein
LVWTSWDTRRRSSSSCTRSSSLRTTCGRAAARLRRRQTRARLSRSCRRWPDGGGGGGKRYTGQIRGCNPMPVRTEALRSHGGLSRSHGGLSQLTSRPTAAVASHQWLAALNQRFQADPPSGGLHTPSGGLHSAGVLVPPLVGNVLTQNWASWRSGGLSQRHHASGCPGLLPASARQPLGPHPATSGLYSA